MPLIDLPLPGDEVPPCEHTRAFLNEAARRIEAFQNERCVPAFVPSDYPRVDRVLRGLIEELGRGLLFCEWGSGVGVVAGLASLAGFDAVGIEIDAGLVDAARRLADDFRLPVAFMHGSFLPPGTRVDADGLVWLTTSHAPVACGPDDFDVIFAYPWSGESDVIASIFERHARPGALLLTYHESGTLRVRCKPVRKSRVLPSRRW
jgi:hypothetical protein